MIKDTIPMKQKKAISQFVKLNRHLIGIGIQFPVSQLLIIFNQAGLISGDIVDP